MRFPRWTVVFLVFVCLVLLNYSLFVLFDSSLVLEKKEINAKVVVSDKIGVEVNGSALAFGTVPRGGGSIKKIMIKNDYDFEVRVNVYSEGSISEFLEVEENNFILKKDEERDLRFVVKTPSSVENGVYEGVVVFEFSKIRD